MLVTDKQENTAPAADQNEQGSGTTPDTQEKAKAKTIEKAKAAFERIKLIAFMVDFMKDPEEAIFSWNITGTGERVGQNVQADIYQKWSKNHYFYLLEQTAKITGSNIDDLIQPDKRTHEQQQVLLKVGAETERLRIEAFLGSKYYQAVRALNKVEGKYHDPHEGNSAYISTKEQAILFFFATNESIMPNDLEPLREENLADRKSIFYRLDEYYIRSPYDPDKEGFAAFYNFIEQEIQPKPKKKTVAETQGAITTIAERLFVPSDPEYQDAFITKIGNSSIGLFKRDAEGGKKQLALDINTTFLQALAKAIFIDFINGKQGETNIYFPSLAKELGYDLNAKKKKGEENSPSRAESRENFINSLIIELDNIWGKLPKDTTEYKLISVHAYNPETEVLYFVSPYLQRLIVALIGKEAAKIESGKHYYLWNCDLLHAAAANERNPAAVEMATRLLVGVQQRGLTPDSELKQNRGKSFADPKAVTFSITCKRIIQDCPQIRERLKAQPNASQKTQTLKRTFTAMYKILKKKTDLFSYYTDVSIAETIPTSRTLDTEIIIIHHGSNPQYSKPILPLCDPE